MKFVLDRRGEGCPESKCRHCQVQEGGQLPSSSGSLRTRQEDENEEMVRKSAERGKKRSEGARKK
jgi:hypothetical protein